MRDVPIYILIILAVTLSGCGGHHPASTPPVASLTATIVLTGDTTARLLFDPTQAERFTLYRSAQAGERGTLVGTPAASPYPLETLVPDTPAYFTLVPETAGRAGAAQTLKVVPFRILPLKWYTAFEDEEGWLWGAPDGSTMLYRSHDQGMTRQPVYNFARHAGTDARISSVFIESRGHILVCLGNGTLFRSTDHGATFAQVLTFRGGPTSRIVTTWGITEDAAGRLYVGEYANRPSDTPDADNPVDRWQNVAYFYWSTDGGGTWASTDYFISQGTPKHLHLVQVDPFHQRLYVTDGDGGLGNGHRLFVNATRKTLTGSLDRAGDGWQELLPRRQGGFTGMAFSARYRHFGTDNLADTSAHPTSNYLARTANDRTFEKWYLPAPFNTRIFALRRVETPEGDELWAAAFDEGQSEAIASGLFYSPDDGASWRLYAQSGPRKAEQPFNWTHMHNTRLNVTRNYLIVSAGPVTIRLRRDR
jgi:hypothetical protein